MSWVVTTDARRFPMFFSSQIFASPLSLSTFPNVSIHLSLSLSVSGFFYVDSGKLGCEIPNSRYILCQGFGELLLILVENDLGFVWLSIFCNVLLVRINFFGCAWSWAWVYWDLARLQNWYAYKFVSFCGLMFISLSCVNLVWHWAIFDSWGLVFRIVLAFQKICLFVWLIVLKLVLWKFLKKKKDCIF